MDRGGVARLAIEVRSALGLRAGDSHRADNKERGGQRHGDFTHQFLLLSGELLGQEKAEDP
jgi:hypothetical protein